MTSKRRYTFWINDTEAEGLKRIKDVKGIAESEQIRQAIREYLQKNDVSKAARPRARTRSRT